MPVSRTRIRGSTRSSSASVSVTFPIVNNLDPFGRRARGHLFARLTSASPSASFHLDARRAVSSFVDSSKRRFDPRGHNLHERREHQLIVVSSERGAFDEGGGVSMPSLAVSFFGARAFPDEERGCDSRRYEAFDQGDVSLEERKVAVDHHRRELGGEMAS